MGQNKKASRLLPTRLATRSTHPAPTEMATKRSHSEISERSEVISTPAIEQPSQLPMALVLEIGGIKPKSKPSALPPSAVVIDAQRLPNPYTLIKQGTLLPTAEAILEWIILAKSPKAGIDINKMVDLAKTAFSSGHSVRIQCYGGAHRSQAVAWKVLSAIEPGMRDRIQVVCLDAPPLFA